MLFFPTPDGGGNRIKYSKKEYLKYFSITALFLFLTVLFVLEFKHYRMIINHSWLLGVAAVLGSLIGIIFAKKYLHNAKDLTERVQIYIFCIVTALVFSPMLVSLTNRLLPKLRTEIVVAELARDEMILAERFGVLKGSKSKDYRYQYHLYLNASVLTFVADSPQFLGKTKGDQVNLQMHQGIWGVKYYSLNRSQ